MAELMAIASQIRRDIVRMVHGASSGHPGGSLGCADFLTALYFKIMKHDPAFNMDAKGEDVFFLSNGHISPLFYGTLPALLHQNSRNGPILNKIMVIYGHWIGKIRLHP